MACFIPARSYGLCVSRDAAYTIYAMVCRLLKQLAEIDAPLRYVWNVWEAFLIATLLFASPPQASLNSGNFTVGWGFSVVYIFILVSVCCTKDNIVGASIARAEKHLHSRNQELPNYLASGKLNFYDKIKTHLCCVRCCYLTELAIALLAYSTAMPAGVPHTRACLATGAFSPVMPKLWQITATQS